MLEPWIPRAWAVPGGRAHTEASQSKPFGHGQTAVSGQRLPTSTAAQSQVASLSLPRRRVLVTQEKFKLSSPPRQRRLLWCPTVLGLQAALPPPATQEVHLPPGWGRAG